MRLMPLIIFLGLSVVSATAMEIKLDDAWIPKLAQLCDGARFASRMTAEPICNELAALVQKAQDEAKKKAEAEPPK